MRGRSATIGIVMALALVAAVGAGAPEKNASSTEVPETVALDSPGSSERSDLQDLPVNPPPLPSEEVDGHSFLSDFEHWLTLVILAFGAFVLLVEYLLLRHAKRSSYDLMQLFAVNLIITGTLVMISAGYSAEQIAPALGLFGTIAGYLLGRRSSSGDSDDDEQ